MHDEIGEYKILGTPLQSYNPRTHAFFPPKLGEHTVNILESLGYENKEIEMFLKKEVVKSSQNNFEFIILYKNRIFSNLQEC